MSSSNIEEVLIASSILRSNGQFVLVTANTFFGLKTIFFLDVFWAFWFGVGLESG